MTYTVTYTYKGKEIVAIDHTTDKSFAKFIFGQLKNCKMENPTCVWYNENNDVIRVIK